MCAKLPPAGQSPWGQKIGRPVLAFPGQHRDWGWRKGESVQMAGLWSGGGQEREVGLGPAVKLDPNLASWANGSSLWLFPSTQNQANSRGDQVLSRPIGLLQPYHGEREEPPLPCNSAAAVPMLSLGTVQESQTAYSSAFRLHCQCLKTLVLHCFLLFLICILQ